MLNSPHAATNALARDVKSLTRAFVRHLHNEHGVSVANIAQELQTTEMEVLSYLKD